MTGRYSRISGEGYETRTPHVDRNRTRLHSDFHAQLLSQNLPSSIAVLVDLNCERLKW